MAVKFSQFVVETDKANVNYLVGWDGTENVQISPADLLSGTPTGIGAAGQVTFFSAASTVTGDNDFYWNNTNKRLGIGTASPAVSLHVDGFARLNGSLQLSGTNRYIYNIGNSGLLLGTNNTERMRIDSSGNIGISTTSPSAKLHVDGTLIATGISQLGSGGSNVYLTSSSAGNVGIGTSSPTHKLTVNAPNDTTAVGIDFPAAHFDFSANSTSGYTTSFHMDNTGTYIGSNSAGRALIFQTNNTDRLYINGNTGNVGIGTSSPSQKLHVNGAVLFDGFAGGSTVGLNVGGTGNGQIRVRHLEGKQSNTSSLGDLFLNNYSSGNIIIGTGGGNVGIGTTSPQKKLDITVSTSDDGVILQTSSGRKSLEMLVDNGTNGQGKINFYTGANLLYGRVMADSEGLNLDTIANRHMRFMQNTTEVMRIDTNQNVGIGTNSPTEKLHVFKDGTAMIKVDSGSSSSPYKAGIEFLRSSVNGGRIYNDGSAVQVKLESDFGYDAANPTRGGFMFKTAPVTSGTLVDVVRINALGNVGIKTTSPASVLHINTGTGTQNSNTVMVDRPASSDYNAISFATAGTVDWSIGQNSANNLEVFEDGVDTKTRLTIQTGGNVGIGADSPTYKLHVDSSITPMAKFEGTNNAYVDFTDPSSHVRLQNSGHSFFGTQSNTDLRFKTNGTVKMSIQNSGYVGVGTESPNALGFLENVLNVSAGSSSSTTLQQAGLVISGSSDSNDADDFCYLSFANHQASSLSADRAAEIRVSKSGTDVNTGKMAFYTANGANLVQAVEIAANQVVKFTSDVETTGATSGFILKSPNGTRYRIQVDNSGNLSASAV